MSSNERQEARFCSKVVTMVPELIRVHPLPSSLFIQAKMMPSCLHRIHRLLLAEEIRESVAEHVGWIVNDASVNLKNSQSKNIFIRWFSLFFIVLRCHIFYQIFVENITVKIFP